MNKDEIGVVAYSTKIAFDQSFVNMSGRCLFCQIEYERANRCGMTVMTPFFVG